MSSREKDPTMPHQPLLSSLVVRPTDSGGGGGGAGSDYEPGEVRRDPPPYSRSDRYDGHGYRMRAGSVSPLRRRDAHHRSSPGFEPSNGASRSRMFGNERETVRHRDYSPPWYGRGRDSGRFPGRGYDQSARGPPGSFRHDGLPRNNPNVRPREGDWICSDPSCQNLNFARRELCNNCDRPRYASSGRGYPGPAFPPRQRVPPSQLDHSPPARIMNAGGYRSPPRGWPRDLRPAARNDARFLDPVMHNSDDRDRYRFDRPPLSSEWGPRDNYFPERRGGGGYGRRVLSPPPPAPAVAPRGWAPHIRDRSRSPVRGAAQPKDYQRDVYMNRRRDDRRGVGRDHAF